MQLRSLPVYFYFLILSMLIAANVSMYQMILAPRVLTADVFTEGKGAATLVRSPGGRMLLIDAGPDASILRALGETLPEWQRDIDVIILTGSKTQFTGGLPDVTRRYHVAAPIRFGSSETPYGSSFTFDKDVSVTVIAAGVFDISYGASSLSISSSTPAGSYISNGISAKKK